MMTGRWIASLAALALFGVLSPGASEAGFLYGVSNTGGTNSVYQVDEGTGQASLVTSLSGANFVFGGAEVYNGKLYLSGVSQGSGPRSFGTLNLTTGAFTALNSMGGDLNWWGLAVDSTTGRFYTVDSDNAGAGTSFPLKYTDANGSSVVTVGNVTGLQAFTGISGLAHDDTNGILYGIGQQDNVLYRINKTTAVATAVGSTGLSQSSGGLAGLAYDQATGTLYLTNRTGPSLGAATSLYRLSTTNGQATLVGATGIGGLEGLAWSPTQLTGSMASVPAPPSLALVGSGALLGLSGLVRRGARRLGASS